MTGLLKYMQHTALMDVATICFGKNKRSNFRIMNPYLATLVGLVWSIDPESYTGSSIATGRASHVMQVKSDDSNKEAYPDSPDLVLDMG